MKAVSANLSIIVVTSPSLLRGFFVTQLAAFGQ
jgi:hypothetical protein